MKRLLLIGMLVVFLAALPCAPAGATGVNFAEPPGSPYETTGQHYTPNPGGLLGGAAVGDFNGDGIDDIAVVNASGLPVFGPGESVTILLGHRDGGLTMAPGSPVEIYSGGIFASQGAVAAGDFNHDGKLDLAVVDNAHSQIWILLGDGTGRFHTTGSPISYALGEEPNAIAVGDFTGSGIQDLAFACGGGKVFVMLGDGSGDFSSAPGSPFSVPGEAMSLAAGRFNSDGLADLAITTLQSQVVIGLATGGGHFAQVEPPLASGGDGTSIVADDLTGNGRTDLAIANSGAGDVTVLLGDGTGNFTAAVGSPFPVPEGTGQAPGLPSSIVAGEFDGDGRPDLAVANFNGSSDDVAVLAGDGAGGFANASDSPIPAHGNPRPLVTGDFNGDGRADLAVVNGFQGTVTVLENANVTAPPTGGSGKPEPTPLPEHAPPPIEPGPPPREAVRALLAAELKSSIAVAARRRPARDGSISFDLDAPEAGVANIDWYAVPRRTRNAHSRPVLLASGALTFSSAKRETMTLYLTRAGRRRWRSGRPLRLRIREEFFPVGQRPIIVARAATVRVPWM